MQKPVARGADIFYGWWIVVSGFVLLFLFAGAGFYSFSIFIQPLEAEFGWARASISLTMSIYFIIGGCMGPFVGKLIQIFGPKRVMLFSALGAGICYMLVSLTQSLWYFYFVYAMLAIMSCGMGPLPVSSMLVNWFEKRRGTATGLAMVGISAGGLILAPVIGKITVIYGWKISYFILGLLTWALALPAVVFVIKNSPSELGLNPDGGASSPKIAEDNFPETGEKSRVQQNQGWSFLDALHSRAFWWIAVSFFLAPLAQMGVLQHQVPIIVDSGTSQATAATALGLIAGIGGLGKLGFGRISEMLPYKWVVLICFGLQALAVFLLIKIHSVLAVWTYVVIFGFGMGGVVVLLPLSVGQYFGLVSFGVILGTLWMVQAIGGALGTFGAGLIYDFFGGYQHALYIFLAAYLAAILAMFLAGQPNPHAKTSQET